MTQPRILIAGIGNIFLGDDAFGVTVAQRLGQRRLPDGVRVVDFGIRGFDLAYALLDGYDATIMVDATPRGGHPGTLYVIEPELDDVGEEEAAVEPHGMDPLKVLRLARMLGGLGPEDKQRLLVVGCEPATFGPDDGQMGLSDAMQGAVDGAVQLIEALVQKLHDEIRGEVQV